MQRIALFGLGSAALSFLEILSDKVRDGHFPHPIGITVIATGSRGLWQLEGGGITPQALIQHLKANKSLATLPGALPFEGTSIELAALGIYDILIELSPLNIHTGQPAIAHLERALERGKSTITANKGPIAWDYQRLQQLARHKGVSFLFETTVMDGTPIFNLMQDTLPHCQVLEIEGILNTTTNFILDEMAKDLSHNHSHDHDHGHSLVDILEEGRKRGFVEADPSMDIEGYDAAAKLCALVNVLMNETLRPTEVHRQGIAHITRGDLTVAHQTGHTIKLMCRARRLPSGGIEASVEPESVPLTSLYATVDATSSVVSLTTDLMGKLSIVEHAPEIQQTGYGIYQDLVRLFRL